MFYGAGLQGAYEKIYRIDNITDPEYFADGEVNVEKFANRHAVRATGFILKKLDDGEDAGSATINHVAIANGAKESADPTLVTNVIHPGSIKTYIIEGSDAGKVFIVGTALS